MRPVIERSNWPVEGSGRRIKGLRASCCRRGGGGRGGAGRGRDYSVKTTTTFDFFTADISALSPALDLAQVRRVRLPMSTKQLIFGLLCPLYCFDLNRKSTLMD